MLYLSSKQKLVALASLFNRLNTAFIYKMNLAVSIQKHSNKSKLINWINCFRKKETSNPKIKAAQIP